MTTQTIIRHLREDLKTLTNKYQAEKQENVVLKEQWTEWKNSIEKIGSECAKYKHENLRLKEKLEKIKTELKTYKVIKNGMDARRK